MEKKKRGYRRDYQNTRENIRKLFQICKKGGRIGLFNLQYIKKGK